MIKSNSRIRSPEETAGSVSRLCFWWMLKLFRKGSKKDLEISDIYAPLKSNESEYHGDRLERAWNIELKKLKTMEYTIGKDGKKMVIASTAPNLLRAIIRTFWWQYLYIGLFIGFSIVVLRTCQPIFQKMIIGYFSVSGTANETSKEDALYYATGLTITNFITVLINSHTGAHSLVVAMRLREACSTLVYRKILRLDMAALNNTTPGQIINLLSNDVSRFETVSAQLNFLWIMPCQILVIGAVMWQSIGIVTLVGLGCVIMLIVPLQIVLNKFTRYLRGRIAVRSDYRIQLMNELISGIQVVKMYTWEKPFERVVSNARTSEMQMIRYASYLRALCIGVMMVCDKISLFATILTYAYMGNTLSADITFPLVTYFNLLQAGAAFFFPHALIQTGEAMVSIGRLQTFLLLDEVSTEKIENKDEVQTKKKSSSTKKQKKLDLVNKAKLDEVARTKIVGENETLEPVTIEMHRVCVNWVVGQLPPILCEVSLTVEGGDLCALVGPVASGKSSLLNALLREMPLGSGTIRLRQRPDTASTDHQKRGFILDNANLRISYSSQDPWLFSGTVRENVLFGQPFDAKRYEEVIKVCALKRDIMYWPHGDQTVVGENGISLSGGQRARINLARAVYKEADLYLLDDPLSAVDTRVARHLFDKCINGYLRGKTRILVTHQIPFLKPANTIVVLDRGMVKSQGKFEELNRNSPEFCALLDQMKKTEEKLQEAKSNSTSVNSLNKDQEIVTVIKKEGSQESLKESNDGSFDGEQVISPHSVDNDRELTDKGRISGRVYMEYMKSCGSWFIIIFLIFMLTIAQIVNSMADYWISYWTNLEAVRMTLKSPDITPEYMRIANNSVFGYFSMLDSDGLLPTASVIDIYTVLIFFCVSFNIFRVFLFMHVCATASQNLHNKMFARVLHATMRFFNANPSGRVLNRFSKDVGILDELLPKATLEAVRLVLLMGSVVMVIIILNGWMIFPLIVLGVFFFYWKNYYVRISQSLRRLEGISQSPVYSHVKATLNGLTTIRSSGSDVILGMKKSFDELEDIHSSTVYLGIMAASTFGFCIDIVVCVFIGCTFFSFILLDDEYTLGGSVGLAISQALLMTGVLQYAARQTAHAMTHMTAIERISQYANLPTEGSLTSANPPPPTWPMEGRITLKNLSLRYRNSEIPVLKNLNVAIKPGWKVGVVGRTGAGKSSLIAALFRLENEGMDGSIIIDGRDTSNLGLHELRSKISIIPQEPVLFSGSLRYNLDPFCCYSDATLWHCLKEVELDELELDQKVMEGGTNFSVGQRQLICLARAILKDNRILLLDEATANIDAQTDSLIQKTLRTRFAKHTVITVAHRLNTVIDSDRILIMDCGNAVEFGCPNVLLRDNPNGPFSQMISQAGITAATNLESAAKAACLRNPKHDCEK